MTDRREFKRAIRVQIIKRATRFVADGLSNQYCEKCGNPTKGAFEVHHLTEDALEVDKSKPLTAEEGALWCKPCHKEHTATVSVPVVAKAKRQEASNLRAEKPNKAEIKSDPHALKSRRRPTHEGRESLPPRAMFVSLGDIASDVLAKLNPKKAAE